MDTQTNKPVETPVVEKRGMIDEVPVEQPKMAIPALKEPTAEQLAHDELQKAVPVDEPKAQTVLENFEEEVIVAEQAPAPTVDNDDATVAQEISQPEVEVTLDDLDVVPDMDKFSVIGFDDEKNVPEKLTIANVKLGRVLTQDNDGNHIKPFVNKKGSKYYKAKLIVELVEEINEKKIRMFIPSIFYSVDENDVINPVPTIPSACTDEKMEDNFTPELAKIRNKFAKFKNIDAKTMSSSEFVKALIGQTFHPGIKKGDYNGPWIKMFIEKFL